MTGEPTAPVPIPDLLDVAFRMEDAASGTAWLVDYEGGRHAMAVVVVDESDRDLIVRGVRDLAARVETLEQALRFYADPASWEKSLPDQRTGYVYSKLSIDGGKKARAALVGQSTTEQP